LRRAFPEARFRLLSRLAEGADRLAAHAAGSSLRAELIAVLPMMSARETETKLAIAATFPPHR
jgi:hypothetical protein